MGAAQGVEREAGWLGWMRGTRARLVDDVIEALNAKTGAGPDRPLLERPDDIALHIGERVSMRLDAPAGAATEWRVYARPDDAPPDDPYVLQHVVPDAGEPARRVRDAFLALLDREADPTGAVRYVASLTQGGMTTAALLHLLATSREAAALGRDVLLVRAVRVADHS